MPNYCNFSCMITGPKKGIDRFIQAAQVNYYGEPEDPEHFWRVFEFIVDIYEDIGNGLYQAVASGYCAWSVHSCFTDGPHTYQSSVPRPHKGITIEQICKEEGLVVEFYSDEIGMGFAEHIIYVVDTLYTDNTSDYTECEPDMDLDELNERSGNDWTQEQWDAYFKKEDYYICCEYNWEFGDHVELLKKE